jgi:predicted deacetylase
MAEFDGARVDLHCHSSASEVSRLGVQRAVGLPGCATPPEDVYELAKRRGMAPGGRTVPREVQKTIAVALHDIEPATFERCALIRDWLDDHGVDRATLLVIPARDLHPVGERSPEMVEWLLERQRRGDSIAQHGFRHEHLRRPDLSQRVRAHTLTGRAFRTAEFVGLDGPETRRAVESGWRLLKLAGIEPEGFVAPAYTYTPALRQVLGTRFRWWASLLGLHGTITLPESAGVPTCTGSEQAARADRAGSTWRRRAPAWTLRTDGRLGQALSPALIRAGAALAGEALRLDLHPCDLQRPRHMLALEWALGRAARRRIAVTYDELATAERLEEISLPRTPRTPRLRAS